jgi:hypothetical protein
MQFHLDRAADKLSREQKQRERQRRKEAAAAVQRRRRAEADAAAAAAAASEAQEQEEELSRRCQEEEKECGGGVVAAGAGAEPQLAQHGRVRAEQKEAFARRPTLAASAAATSQLPRVASRCQQLCFRGRPPALERLAVEQFRLAEPQLWRACADANAEALADALLARFGNDGAHPRKKKSSKHAPKGGRQQEGGERTRRALACSALRLVRAPPPGAGHLMQQQPALTTLHWPRPFVPSPPPL